MSGITHLLFDCDGTLVDSERIVMAAMQLAGGRLGLELTREDCHRLFLGHIRRHCLRVFEQHYGAPLPESFAIDLAAAIRHRLETELQPVPGVAAALEQLPQIKCLVSNGSPEHVSFVLEKTGLVTPFVGRCYSAIPPCEPKPSPMLYRQTMERLGIEPQQCIAIEDSAAGVTAAVAAGIRTLGFAMLAGREQLLRVGALAAFSDMVALPGLIATIEASATGAGAHTAATIVNA
ncbi:HAD family phosphatase [Crenobacter sp. SG2305]|uniref:HAD family hydrolase n=1 Tax=Crenobacter oryzisoli TaxID=3056844 RepID=UPI0025AB2D7A|nr:HAD family phosphatase [Crenobacter sp. SG2305]MDN0081832.1 HAD family phosphatase [Crenobacter sp. SG2305]